MSRTVEEYLDHAAECRRLAFALSHPQHRKVLIHMAETWERLAHPQSGRVHGIPAPAEWPQNQ